MSLFAWLRPTQPSLDADLCQRIARLPKTAPTLGVLSLREQRWVVLDLETSGLNVNRDRCCRSARSPSRMAPSISANSSSAPCTARRRRPTPAS